MNYDSRFQRNPGQQNSEVSTAQPDATGRGRKSQTSQMNEHGAAAPGDARTGVMVDFDNKIIQVIDPLQAIT
jgi:hypothetical protein